MNSSSLLPTAMTTVAGSLRAAASSAGDTSSPEEVAARTASAVSIVDIRQEHRCTPVECQQEGRFCWGRTAVLVKEGDHPPRFPQVFRVLHTARAFREQPLFFPRREDVARRH